MTEKTTSLFQHPCLGCRSWQQIDGEFICLNLVTWHDQIPEHPDCFNLDEGFAAADHQVGEAMWRRAKEIRAAGSISRGELVLVSHLCAVHAMLNGDDAEAEARIELGAELLAMHVDDLAECSQTPPSVASHLVARGVKP